MLYVFDNNENLLEIIENFYDSEMSRELNGDWTFEFKINIKETTNIKRKNKVGFYIDDRFYLFSIEEIEDTFFSDDEKRIYCHNDIFNLNDHIIEEKRCVNYTADRTLEKALEGTNYKVGNVSVLNSNTISFYYKSSLTALKEILNLYDCEYDVRIVLNEETNTLDKYVDLVQKIGTETGLRFTYDTNIESIKRTEISDQHYNVLYGRGASLSNTNESGEATGGYTRLIDFGDIDYSIENGNRFDKPKGQKYVEDLDSIEKYGRLEGIYENKDITDKVMLLEETYKKLQETKEPSVSYEINVKDLSDVEGFEHYSYNLGDGIIILDDEYKIDLESRIIKEKIDIQENDKTITLGYIYPSQSNITIQQNIAQIEKEETEAHDKDMENDRFINKYNAQIINRKIEFTNDFYVAKVSTGDGTGRNENNKSDSLQTVLNYITSQGCMFFDNITIHIEDGCRIREKIVIQDFYGTVLMILFGKDAVLSLQEGTCIEDTFCRLFIESENLIKMLEEDDSSEKVNQLGCLVIEDQNGIEIRNASYVMFNSLRVRGTDNEQLFNVVGGANACLWNSDVSNAKCISNINSTGRFSMVACRGNVGKLAVVYDGILQKPSRIPVISEESPVVYYNPGIDVTNHITSFTYFDTLFQDTYSSDVYTNTMRIFSTNQEWTEQEGEGKLDTENLLNLVGQGRWKTEYKSLHGHGVFASSSSNSSNSANEESLQDFAKTREKCELYLRMTRVDTNTNEVIPRVRFQLSNGEYTAYYKLEPLSSLYDETGSQLRDYSTTESKLLPQELTDKIIKFGVYSVEFQSDSVEDYLVVDNVALVIKGTVKEKTEDSGEVKATAKILANALNVRKNPGTSGEYVGLLSYGDIVEIIGVDPDTGWYKIKYNGDYAYITNKSEYVEIISGDPNGTTTVSKVEVLAENLNVRTGGSTSYNSIGTVPKGFTADILETDSTTGWYKISYNGEYGWITNNTTYVKVITGTVSVQKELYDGAKVASNAESYYNARNNYTSAKSWNNGFTYGERTPIDSSASGTQGASYSIWEKSSSGNYWKMIDDSTLMILCLQGYNYNESPYASLTNFNVYHSNRLQTNSSYSGAISPTNGGSLARTASQIAQYFYELGQTITAKDDYSNLQKGDLIFYARKNSSGSYIYPSRWKYISNCAICIGTNENDKMQIITAMSKPGESHADGWYTGLKKDLLENQQPDTIVLIARPSSKVTSSGSTTGGGSSSGNITGGGSTTTINNMRKTIVDTGMSIVEMYNRREATYSQMYRTISLSRLNTVKSMTEWGYRHQSWVKLNKTYGFDCSSLVGCCYEKAGISYMTNKSCAGGTLQATAKKHGATFWRYADSGLIKCKPGDIVMYANDGYTVTTSNMATVKTHHTALYAGNGYVIEASGYNSGILYHKRTFNNKCFFIRLPELSKADSASSPVVTVKEEYKNCFNERGTIDGHNYVYRLHDARCTCYSAPESNTSGASGLGCHMGKTVASLNLSYGTKIYIPALKNQVWTNANGTKVTLDGVFTVSDTGVGMFDFDIVAGSTSSACYKNYPNPKRMEVYVLEWGTSTKQTWSYTDSYKWAYNNGVLSRYKSAFKNYISNDGVLINMLKFYNDDANIRNSTYWNILNS